jgi:hypothetical protein
MSSAATTHVVCRSLHHRAEEKGTYVEKPSSLL